MKISRFVLSTALLIPALLLAAPVSGKFADPKGRMALIIGQTTDGIRAYVDDSKLPAPYGVTLYVSPTLESAGFTKADGTLSGDFDGLTKKYGPQDLGYIEHSTRLKKSAIVVGLYLASNLAYDIATGKNLSNENDDGRLWKNTQRIITDLKNTDRPVFLRIGYEAEAPWNNYSPEEYKKAWAKIVAEIKTQKANNIATVWQLAAFCPSTDFWGAGIKPMTLVASNPDEDTPAQVQNVPEDNVGAVYDLWYPDVAPDWTGLSIFDPQNCTGGYGTVQKVVDYLKTKGKPIMLAEAAMRGYDYDLATGLYTYEQLGETKQHDLTPDVVWNTWFKPFFAFVRKNHDSIRALAYINDDWQRYTHWACATDDTGVRTSGCAEANWGNSRVDVNPIIKAKWRKELGRDGRFVSTLEGK